MDGVYLCVCVWSWVQFPEVNFLGLEIRRPCVEEVGQEGREAPHDGRRRGRRRLSSRVPCTCHNSSSASCNHADASLWVCLHPSWSGLSR